MNYWQKFQECGYYHIYNRSINKELLYYSDRNYNFFLLRWQQLISPFCDTLAYCLIPNHFHFLVKIKLVDAIIINLAQELGTGASKKFINEEITFNQLLEDQFKRLFSSYTLSINKEHNRRGSLFSKRFKRVELFTVHRIIYILTYIHNNPVHHGLVLSYDDWRYSSYTHFFGETKSLINKYVVFSLMNSKGNELDNFKSFHRDFVKDSPTTVSLENHYR